VSQDLMDQIQRIAILGGTGKEGKGLAFRWAKAGKEILIGSRSVEKARAAAVDVLALLEGQGNVSGCTNDEAAQAAEIIVLTVPYGVHRDMLETVRPYVQGKIFVDVTVPLVPPKVTRVQMPAAGSAGQEAQQILGPEVRVVTAFQNISYENLIRGEGHDCDVLVCGNDKSARAIVIGMVQMTGLVGWDAGPIDNSVVAEGLTSILIGINKQYGVQAAGIRITGVNRPDLDH
jgi:NADPH-dependent F420 reductase